MKTQEEIVKQVEKKTADDLFGFQTSCLIPYLDYEHAKQYLKPEVTRENWQREEKSPADEIKDYMPFAWDKANNCRGISASRSIEHMIGWLWLDGKDELLPKMESEYEFYGKPCLVLVCQEYGIDWRELDDGLWGNDEDGVKIKAEEALAQHGIVMDIKEKGVEK